MAKVAQSVGAKKKKTKVIKKKKVAKPVEEYSESSDDEVPDVVYAQKKPFQKVQSSKELPVSHDSDVSENLDDEESESEQDESALMAEKFRNKMANLPLSQVRAMKEKLGIKLFNKAYFGEKEKATKEAPAPRKFVVEKKGQHRPKEVSSRKRVSALRNIYPETKTAVRRDPRFDERAGTFKEVCFEDNYRFLDDVRKEEKEHLRKNIKDRMESGQDGGHYVDDLRRLETQERAQKEKRLRSDTMKELRQENIDRLMQGEKPIFKTKAEVRKKIMEKRFGQLKQENRLTKYLEKREKKESERLMKKKPEGFEQKYGYH